MVGKDLGPSSRFVQEALLPVKQCTGLRRLAKRLSFFSDLAPFWRGLGPTEGREHPARRIAARGVVALALAFVALGLIYSVVNPVYEAPDEAYHYPLVRHLAQGGAWPVQDAGHPQAWRQEAGQPPLYYFLAAAVTHWVPSDDLEEAVPQYPHAAIGWSHPDGHANFAVHTPRQSFPYRGAVLAIHLARGLSVLLGAVTVLCTYGLGLELLPHCPYLALSAAGVVAFTPMFLFVSAAVSNDGLVTALCTCALWQLVRLLRLPPTPARWLALGVTIGLATLAKTSGLGLLPLALLALLLVARRRKDSKLILWGSACVCVTVGLLTGWWFVRNWRLYHDPLGWNVFVAMVGRRPNGFSLRELASEMAGLFKSYWGVFGWMNVVLPAWLYRLLLVLTVVAAIGLLRLLWGSFRYRKEKAPPWVALGLVVLWPLVVGVAFVRWTLLTPASQGRLLFPAIAPLALLLVLGCRGWAPWDVRRETSNVKRQTSNVKRQTSGMTSVRLTFDVSRLTPHVLCLAPVALMAGLAVWVPFGVIAPAYAPPPFLSESQVAVVPNRLSYSFDGQMELLGYELPAQAVQPGEWVKITLYWRATASMTENYSVFVHLLDRWQVVVAQRDRYPGRGLLPTSQWHPGDALADTYYLQLPSDLAKPMDLQVRVGLYRLATGGRLAVYDSQGQAVGDYVALGSIRVQPASCERIEHAVYYNLEDQIALIGYSLESDHVQPGQVLHLTLFWQALAPPSADYTVFTHLLAPGNVIVAQEDAPPWGGAAPTASWQAGEVFCDTYALQVRSDAPTGAAELEVGMYRQETMQRLQLLAPGGELLGDRIVLANVHVQR